MADTVLSYPASLGYASWQMRKDYAGNTRSVQAGAYSKRAFLRTATRRRWQGRFELPLRDRLDAAGRVAVDRLQAAALDGRYCIRLPIPTRGTEAQRNLPLPTSRRVITAASGQSFTVGCGIYYDGYVYFLSNDGSGGYWLNAVHHNNPDLDQSPIKWALPSSSTIEYNGLTVLRSGLSFHLVALQHDWTAGSRRRKHLFRVSPDLNLWSGPVAVGTTLPVPLSEFEASVRMKWRNNVLAIELINTYAAAGTDHHWVSWDTNGALTEFRNRRSITRVSASEDIALDGTYLWTASVFGQGNAAAWRISSGKRAPEQDFSVDLPGLQDLYDFDIQPNGETAALLYEETMLQFRRIPVRSFREGLGSTIVARPLSVTPARQEEDGTPRGAVIEWVENV